MPIRIYGFRQAILKDQKSPGNVKQEPEAVHHL
jgi:hypothetical protein